MKPKFDLFGLKSIMLAAAGTGLVFVALVAFITRDLLIFMLLLFTTGLISIALVALSKILDNQEKMSAALRRTEERLHRPENDGKE